MIAKKKTKEDEPAFLDIKPLERRELSFFLVGTMPLIMNRMPEKARQQLMLPPLPMNKAEKHTTLKHNPYEEFRGSAYISRRPSDRTYLHMPAEAFKAAIADCALDIPGATKSQVGRLVSMATETVDIWGIPTLRFDMVRQAGIARTPDTRFRCCLPEWCCEIIVRFVTPLVPPKSLATLIDAAGIIRGVGDYRTEKGKGDYGQFRIVRGHDDEDFQRIVAAGGTEVQKRAMANPSFYNDEAAEMAAYFDEEVARRRAMPTELPKRSRKANAEEAIQ